jgi:hypothetical protein
LQKNKQTNKQAKKGKERKDNNNNNNNNKGITDVKLRCKLGVME